MGDVLNISVEKVENSGTMEAEATFVISNDIGHEVEVTGEWSDINDWDDRDSDFVVYDVYETVTLGDLVVEIDMITATRDGDTYAAVVSVLYGEEAQTVEISTPNTDGSAHGFVEF